MGIVFIGREIVCLAAALGPLEREREREREKERERERERERQRESERELSAQKSRNTQVAFNNFIHSKKETCASRVNQGTQDLCALIRYFQGSSTNILRCSK